MKSILVGSIVIASFLSSTVVAAEKKQSLTEKRTATIESHKAKQAKRVEGGLKSGNLTTNEIAQINDRKAQIEQLDKSIKADGKITKAEAVEMRKLQKEASLKIKALKTNNLNSENPEAVTREAIHAQDKKLADGIQSGKLNSAEAEELKADLKKIRQARIKAMKDKKISEAEAKELEAQQAALTSKMASMSSNVDQPAVPAVPPVAETPATETPVADVEVTEDEVPEVMDDGGLSLADVGLSETAVSAEPAQPEAVVIPVVKKDSSRAPASINSGIK